jgi:hypothetical protein
LEANCIEPFLFQLVFPVHVNEMDSSY